MMHLFKRLISRPERSMFPDADLVAARPFAPERSVRDLFHMDIDRISLQHFTEEETEWSRDGSCVRTYHQLLDYKECGLFDKVCVKTVGDNARNIIFRSSDPEGVPASQVTKLIDELYAIYGRDSNGKGTAAQEFGSGNSLMQGPVPVSRDWMDYPKYPYPVSLRRYAHEVFISIWGFTGTYTA